MSKLNETEKGAERAVQEFKEAIIKAREALEELRSMELQELDDADLEAMEAAIVQAWAAEKIRGYVDKHARQHLHAAREVLNQAMKLLSKVQPDVARRGFTDQATGTDRAARAGAFARYTESGS